MKISTSVSSFKLSSYFIHPMVLVSITSLSVQENGIYVSFETSFEDLGVEGLGLTVLFTSLGLVYSGSFRIWSPPSSSERLTEENDIQTIVRTNSSPKTIELCANLISNEIRGPRECQETTNITSWRFPNNNNKKRLMCGLKITLDYSRFPSAAVCQLQKCESAVGNIW